MATDYNLPTSAGRDAIVTDSGAYLSLDEIIAEETGQSVDTSLPATPAASGAASTPTDAVGRAVEAVKDGAAAVQDAAKDAADKASKHPIVLATIAAAIVAAVAWLWRVQGGSK